MFCPKCVRTWNGITSGKGPFYRLIKCVGCGIWLEQYVDKIMWTRTIAYCEECGTKAGRRPVQPPEVPFEYRSAEIGDAGSKVEAFLSEWPQKTKLIGLSGPPGRGKTHLAWAMVNHLYYKQNLAGLYLDAGEARERWVKSIDLQIGDDLVFAWKNTSHLLLDDLTRGSATDGWKERLMQIIDHRTKHCLPTFLTNMTSSAVISELYGDEFMSRLKYFRWMQLNGPDRRKPKDANQTN
jgi:DNA replication protein DnaC